MTAPSGHATSLSPTLREAAALALVGASNFAINRARNRPETIAASLGAAGGMLLLAAAEGATAAEQGLELRAAQRGILTGLLIGVPLAGGAAVGAYLPGTRRFFQDHRIVGADSLTAAYELFVRIPLVTAAAEEIIFRSAMEGILARRRSPGRAALMSAALFGAWHIMPTIDRLHSNPGAADTHQGSALRQAGIVAGVCIATAAAGFGLSWLRRSTRSVFTPVVVHTAINAGAFAGGWFAHSDKRRP